MSDKLTPREQWRAAMELLEERDKADRAELHRLEGLTQAELDEELKAKGIDPKKAGAIGLEALEKFRQQQAAAKAPSPPTMPSLRERGGLTALVPV